MPKDTLTITDNRTGKAYEVPITHDAIKAIDLRQIKVNPDDFGMMSFDPGFTNTAHCESSITYIDGDKGILRYRGYPIEQLAGKASFLEVSYLIMFGELPTKAHLAEWTNNIVHHTFLHENAKTFLDGFRYDAHPMGVFISTVAALSTFYPEANQIDDPVIRQHQIHRLIAKTPTIAAFAYRHMRGLP
ncbi:MAG: citrate (Si)-synthase, partial [Gemmatimonadota bacterium]|nr:citrate (Si)-synthase [Gemmatimonadota bacterium]